MGCAVKGCQEGGELKIDPCSVCGNLVHRICAIGVFEGATSALNERFCSKFCVQVVYPRTEAPVLAVSSATRQPATSSATAKKPSSNIWTGSDSDFTPSRDLPAASDLSTTERAAKRRKTAPTTSKT
ncbi:hypothetical protein JG688_00011318 [Phytophthora aleatoria]|uniref:Uncharacterized protein n=1 Tax=Phytophthora aleatoria TaxID=2496075 RepID=A0A8J5M5C0_9STRA|nr:hypothetical protein JG688_00011318 [Phytophthora aleatoria]